jgi:aspartate racemase
MAKHVGIVACSAEGAALCYRTICVEGEKLMGKYTHPEVSMHTHPLNIYMKYINAGNWSGVADLMLSSAEKLASAGADFLICPDNTIHQAFDIVIKRSPLPFLNIAEEVVLHAREKGYRMIGILGTKLLMEGPVYQKKLKENNIGHAFPEKDERLKISEIILNELVYGIIKESSKNTLLSIIKNMASRGCNAVVLGCTELPLIVYPEDSSLPTLDSTRILARSALRYAL